MDQKIIINCNFKQTRVALLEDGKVMELYIERPLHQRMVGNIYKGRVENVLPGMQAAFVDIGEERNAFFYVDDIPHPRGEERVEGRATIQQLLHAGEEVLVQVMKDSFGSKGARLTGHITLPGRYLVLMPGLNYVGVSRRIDSQGERERLKRLMEELRPPEVGLIVRTAAEGADQESLGNDLQFLLRLWKKIINLSKKENSPALLHKDMALVYRMMHDLLMITSAS